MSKTKNQVSRWAIFRCKTHQSEDGRDPMLKRVEKIEQLLDCHFGVRNVLHEGVRVIQIRHLEIQAEISNCSKHSRNDEPAYVRNLCIFPANVQSARSAEREGLCCASSLLFLRWLTPRTTSSRPSEGKMQTDIFLVVGTCVILLYLTHRF